MNFIKTVSLSALIIILLSTNIFSQVKTLPPGNKAPTEPNSVSLKYGALAIDRRNGFYFGWAYDCPTLSDAEKKAIEECKKKGGNCTVVLSFSGTGYAAYRFITGNVGLGYGWGLAKTKEKADSLAKKECAERSFGLPAPNFILKCNSPNSGELKSIYDAHNEISKMQTGVITNY